MAEQNPAQEWTGTAVAPSSRSWFQLLGLALLAFVALVGGGILWIQVMDPGPHEATSSEARAALGMLKDRARVVYQRTGVVPRDLAELGVSDNELSGTYYKSANYIIVGGRPDCWSAVCTSVYTSKPSHLIVTADLVSGSSSFNR